MEVLIVGFEGQTPYPLWTNKWHVRVEDKENSRTIETNFLAMDIPIAYIAILRCLSLNTIKAVVAPYLLLIQFELDDIRVGKLFGDQKMPENITVWALSL